MSLSSANTHVLLDVGGIVLLFISIVASYIFYDHLRSRSRALATNPVGYKDGMVFDIKTRHLRSVRTAVHMDPRTGVRHLGKQVIS